MAAPRYVSPSWEGNRLRSPLTVLKASDRGKKMMSNYYPHYTDRECSMKVHDSHTMLTWIAALITVLIVIMAVAIVTAHKGYVDSANTTGHLVVARLDR
jgi:hypothetical protein